MNRDSLIPFFALALVIGTGALVTAAPGPIIVQRDTLKNGGTMDSGSVIDVKGGYIYDSTDSLALGGVCTNGVSGDMCSNSVLFSDGAVTAGPITANGGIIIPDNDNFMLGDDDDFWMTYVSATGRFELWTSDSDGAGADANILYVLDGTDDVVVPGEITIDGVTGSQNVVCVKSNGQFGHCSGGIAAGGTCTCV